MKGSYIAAIILAVVLSVSSEASAQGTPNGTTNGYQSGQQNGTRNAVANGSTSNHSASGNIVMKGSRINNNAPRSTKNGNVSPGFYLFIDFQADTGIQKNGNLSKNAAEQNTLRYINRSMASQTRRVKVESKPRSRQ